MDLHTLLGLLILAAALAVLLAIRSVLRRRTLRRPHAQQPAIHAVGSPEYNAQIVDALRQVNERLAKDGKRVPERAAIDIITQISTHYGSKPEQED